MRFDPLNDALSMIKNAELAGKGECYVRPSNRLIGWVLEVFREHGYIQGFERMEDGKSGVFHVILQGNINNCGVIKPRFSVRRVDLEDFESRYLPAQDFGVLVLTTTAGVLSHRKAKELGVGGKLLAFIY